MSKKRKTREEKIKTSLRRAEIDNFQPAAFSFVKREFNQNQQSFISKDITNKKQVNSNQIDFSASIKFDILKTFILASLVFAAEAMLYWLWK